MNGTLGVKQSGSVNSGVLGQAPAVSQPGAYRSGSLGHYKQPGSYNSGSLGFHEPGVVNSGILGEYFSPGVNMNGVGVLAPYAAQAGPMGEYFASGVEGLGRTGCGCSTPQSGMGATVRVNGRRLHRSRSMRGFGALGSLSIGLDMIVGVGLGIGAVWAISKA